MDELFKSALSRRKALQLLGVAGGSAALPKFASGLTPSAVPAGQKSTPRGGARPFLIDTDTASDDAVALVMALQHPGVKVEAITVVAGNVNVNKGLQNALYTRDLCGKKNVPVYRGAEAPLVQPYHNAEYVHGHDGMGDIGLPLHGRSPAPGDAVPAMIETIHRHAGELTLVTLGPLTNLALALKQEPGIAKMVKRYVMMGGVGWGPGNVTPVAEYNIWVDPEAAKIVFASGLPTVMAGWDISRLYAVFDPEDTARLRGVGTPLAKFCVDIQRKLTEFALKTTHLRGFDLPDPIAMAVALDPSVATKVERAYVDVEIQGGLSLGQTVVDHLKVTGKAPNTDVVREASREKFLKILYDAVQS